MRELAGAQKRPSGRRYTVLARLSLLLASTALFSVARLPAANAACPPSDCWTGATSADWFVPSNWTTGTPDATTNIVINQGSPNANPSIGINGTSNAAASAAVEIADTTGTTGLVTVSTTNTHPASWTITGILRSAKTAPARSTFPTAPP